MADGRTLAPTTGDIADQGEGCARAFPDAIRRGHSACGAQSHEGVGEAYTCGPLVLHMWPLCVL
ncbi:hypothetical protein DEF23_02635 [Marinitenerispora sediminis]|uniref:Uncharacterized protein n=1 Tax=Marinitenerispora sediminis TaxID=1931232 RepID=A0A368T686_9ACTN|nr:hypothetical protein DEF28_01630 [Marinitenerispora sediminis]RCV58982.1 hypothetical protein DEF24_11500 [Marinitenerispora sediminis]RCV61274.1 hypothetical protein DEF23_02635 [Marinitenerispora sediminis]